LADLARLNRDKAEYAKARLAEIPGVTVLQSAPTFNEFTLVLPVSAEAVVTGMLKEGVAAGVPLGGYYAGSDNCLVVTVTEKRSKKEIDHFARLLEAALCN
jgi:glycine dehydrogenase subunit 1